MTDLPSSFRGNRYAVIRMLGEGGQATTFEAVDKKEGKPVAIKRFRVRGAKSWKEVEFAEREARVLASLSHAGLPQYVEHFEENGQLFLVTQKIEGESLLAIQKRGATLSSNDLIRFLRETSDILDYLHGRSPPVVHRDIKPSNVLRRPDGSFALIDFGAVRDKMKPEGGSTVVGTFGFMAPEQFQGRAMPASDVYAVGATALTMLTGIQPEDLPHKGLAIDVATALGKTADPALVAALQSMLEPDPDKRASRIAPLLTGLREPPGKTNTETPAQKSNDKKKKSEKSRTLEQEIEEEVGQAVEELVQNFAELGKEWEDKARKHASKAERKARRAERKAERWAHREVPRPAYEHESKGIPGPVAALLLFGLTVGQLAVLVALHAVVPAVLALLSVVFGKKLREAGAKVREAGIRARASMEQAKTVIRERTERQTSGVRVDVPSNEPRVRFVEKEPADTAAEEELAAEEEAHAAAKEQRKNRRSN
jgi:tRNA A-37 threonylcarbamoyl transferase component Bud32